MHIGTHIIILGFGLVFFAGCARDKKPLSHSGSGQQTLAGTHDVMVENRVGPSPDGSHNLRLEWYVPRSVLERQPRWNPFSNKPPLSIAKASSLALSLAQQRFPEIKEWVVQDVELRNLAGYLNMVSESYPDVWYYRFSFKPRDPQVFERLGSGFWNDPALEQVVLFDGTIVTPRVTTE